MSFGLKKVFSKHGGRILERWVFDAKSPLVSPATVADLNHDGTHSVIFGTKDGMVICIGEDGKEQWRFQTREQLSAVDSFFVDEERVHSIDAPPVVADVNMDGIQEILVGTELGTLYCISAQGKLLWKHECGGSIKASCVVTDINSDGRPEILVGSVNNRLWALRGDGEPLFSYATDAPVESVPGVLKSSKRNVIVFGDSKGVLTAITPSQDLVWRVELDSKITAAPSFFHVQEEGARIAIGTHAGRMFCVNDHGEVLWEYKTKGSIYSAAAIADITDDHLPEIVFGSCDNNVYVLSAGGQKIWSYETDFWITTTPIVADIDDDGKLEVIAGSYDHNVYVLDSAGLYVLDYVPGLSTIVNQAGHYGNLVTNDPGEQTGKKLYQYKTDGIVVGCALLERKEKKPALIVNVKTGQVDDLEHEE